MQLKMSSMNIQRTRRNSLLAISCILLSACVTDSTNVRDEEPDMTGVRCANGQPLACVEKMGKTTNCTCRSLGDLERLTKDGLRNW